MRCLSMLLVYVGSAATIPRGTAAEPTVYQVGAGAMPITPKLSAEAPPIWLSGYGPGRRAERIHDDIWARAIYIRDGRFGVAVAALDLCGLTRDVVQQIRGQVADLKLDPPIDYVLVSSTHSHAAPDTLGIWGPVGQTGIIRGYLARIRDVTAEVIRRAHADAKPASLRIAQADVNEVAQLIGDLRLPEVIDSRLTVIQAADTAGRVVATLVNVPCHPEVLSEHNRQLSSDFPSEEREYLEKQFGGIAVHNTGSIGGLLTPFPPATDPFTLEALPVDEIGRMTAYGRIIGRIAERAVVKAERLGGPIRAVCKEVLIPVANQLYGIGMVTGISPRQAYDAEGRPRGIARPTSARSVPVGQMNGGLYIRTEVGLLEIGPLQVAAIPGEVYPEITLDRYERPQQAGADFPGAPFEPPIFPLMTGKYKMVIGLANDEIGYIIPKSQWDWLAPYAYNLKERQYGEFSSVGPEAAPLVMAAWESLVKEATSSRAPSRPLP